MDLQCYGGTTTNGTVLFTLPDGFRPGMDVLRLGTDLSAGNSIPFRIRPDGEIVGEQGLSAGVTALSAFFHAA